MSKFSSTVKVGDLNDFIAPSQACVVSLQGTKLDAAPPADLQVLLYAIQLPHMHACQLHGA